jgi:hypothetical protein
MFIEVNSTYQDKREYERKILLLKRLLEYELRESARKYGFANARGYLLHTETGLRAKLVFEEPEQKPL